MLTNTYECLAIILRSLRLVANCIRKPIRLIFATFWRICREYFFLHSQGYSPQCESSITKWLASAGMVGTNVAGQVGTCCGVGFYIYNNNFALVYSFLLVGLRTPVHSRTCTRTHARARTHTFSINSTHTYSFD